MFENMIYIWIAAMVGFLILEAIIPGLVSVWFAIGSLSAIIATALDAPLWLQLAVFAAVSVATLLATRPLVKKYINGRTTPTNADAVIGLECIVTEEVDNIRGTGTANVGGRVWSARSADDAVVISSGSRAVIKSIAGVKIIIEPVKED